MKAIIRNDIIGQGLNVMLHNGKVISGSTLYHAKFDGNKFFISINDEWVEATSIDFDLLPDNNWPNGFTSWIETYYEVVSRINYIQATNSVSSVIEEIQEHHGRGGLYGLAERLTDEFEEIHRGRQWDGEYIDTIEEFLNRQLS